MKLMYKFYICICSIHTLLHYFIYHTYMVMFIRTYVSSPPLPLSHLISLSLFSAGKWKEGERKATSCFSLSLIIYLSSPSLPLSFPSSTSPLLPSLLPSLSPLLPSLSPSFFFPYTYIQIALSFLTCHSMFVSSQCSSLYLFT